MSTLPPRDRATLARNAAETAYRSILNNADANSESALKSVEQRLSDQQIVVDAIQDHLDSLYASRECYLRGDDGQVAEQLAREKDILERLKSARRGLTRAAQIRFSEGKR